MINYELEVKIYATKTTFSDGCAGYDLKETICTLNNRLNLVKKIFLKTTIIWRKNIGQIVIEINLKIKTNIKKIHKFLAMT